MERNIFSCVRCKKTSIVLNTNRLGRLGRRTVHNHFPTHKMLKKSSGVCGTKHVGSYEPLSI